MPEPLRRVAEGDGIEALGLALRGARRSRPHRRPCRLFRARGAGRPAAVLWRHPSLRRLRPAVRGHAGADVGLAGQTRAPARRHRVCCAHEYTLSNLQLRAGGRAGTIPCWRTTRRAARRCAPTASRPCPPAWGSSGRSTPSCACAKLRCAQRRSPGSPARPATALFAALRGGRTARALPPQAATSMPRRSMKRTTSSRPGGS